MRPFLSFPSCSLRLWSPRVLSLRYTAAATSAVPSSSSSPPPPPPMSPGVVPPSPSHPSKKQQKRLRQSQQQQQSATASSSSVSSSSSVVNPQATMVQQQQQQKHADVMMKRVVPSSAYTSFNRTVNAAYLRDTYQTSLLPGDRDPSNTPIQLGGRVVSIRDLGKLLFLTLRSDGTQMQVCANVGEYFTREQLNELKQGVTTGDVVGVCGFLGKTKKGELSLFATSIKILAPYVCSDLTVIPDQRTFSAAASGGARSVTGSSNSSNNGGSVSDPEVKYRYRFVDMIADPRTIEVFRLRHLVIDALRTFLNRRGFTEVETPVFHSVPCGANARPFTTHHNCNDTDLFLRIAPELFLKQCVVGGMDRVYEIGKVFRNEDSDRSHNPEFTSCEFYAAYHTYEDLMVMTEELLHDLCRAAAKGNNRSNVSSSDEEALRVEVTSCVTKEPTVIDFSQPFRRVSVYDEIQRITGVTLPPPDELDTSTGRAFLCALMLQYNVPFPSVRTAAKLFDKLIDFFITDHVVQPTFVCDHPLFMSPLAKEHESRPGLSERFELFINGMEVCNSYSELNDPQEQLRRFEQQMRDKDLGDDEAMSLDETFLKSLQTGMPPTAGWGMGIDRVVMLLSGSQTIRDVIIFPLLRPDVSSNDVKRRRKTASFFGFNEQMTLFCLSALEAELQRRGELGMKTEHLKALRKTVLEMNRRSHELEEKLAQCQSASTTGGGVPCGLLSRVLYHILCGRGKA